MCGFRKYPSPSWKVIGNLGAGGGGGGSQKLKFLKESIKLNWNLKGVGRGPNQKTLPWEGYGYFLEHN